MLSCEEYRFAIEDARTRQAAIINLISATDSQAMSLLSLYVTLGIASASGMVAALSAPFAHPGALFAALSVSAAMFVTGSVYCFKAMASAAINLPGRQAEFWCWAAGPSISFETACVEYLSHLQPKHEMNDAVNLAASMSLRIARGIGIAAPPAATMTGLAFFVLRLLGLSPF
jgi:hypothetical protein